MQAVIEYIQKNGFAANSLILFTGSMLVNILNYVFHVVVGRLVSVGVYGEVESLTSLMAIISVPAVALAMVAAKYGATCKAENDKRKSRQVLAYLNKKIVAYGIPIFLVAVLLTPLIRNFLNIQSAAPLFFLWVMMFVSFLLSVNTGLLNGWQKFKDVSIANIWGSVVKLLAGIILVKIGFALNGVLGSFLLGAIASYLISVMMLKYVVKGSDNKQDMGAKPPAFEPFRGYMLPVFWGSLAITVLGNVDMVVAKHNLSSDVAGQYGALTIASKIIFFGTGVISSVLFAMVAERDHNKQDCTYILRNALALTVFVTVVATTLYFLFPTIILGLLFGGTYQITSPYLGWFAVMVSLFSFSNLIFQYLLSIRETMIVYVLLCVSLVESVLILLLGTTLSTTLLIVLITQVVTLVAAISLLFYKVSWRRLFV